MINPCHGESITIEQSGVESTVSFGIKNEDMGHIFHILRNTLYSDPILAVVRELSCNGADANAVAGTPDKPILISLPSMLDSFFKIRDYGSGLNDEQIQKVFVNYGSSTKRGDNITTGCLGIGAKSPFAYNDSFSIHSYHKGTMTVWNAFLDATKKGAMSKMYEGPTDEPNGLEVVLPVKNDDIEKFREKSFNFFTYFRVCPIFKNITPEELSTLETLRNRKAEFEGTNWKYFGTGQSYAVMGNIAYPLRTDAFTEQELTSDAREFIEGGMVMYFDLGTLEFAASREAIQYGPVTKKSILNRFQDISKEIETAAASKFANCKTLWEAKLLWKNVFRAGGNLYRLRNLFDKSIMFNGFKLNELFFQCGNNPNYALNVAVYTRGYHRNGKIEKQDTAIIDVEETSMVVLNDTEITNGIVNRVLDALHNKGKYKVYVIKPFGSTDLASWQQTTGYDGELISLATLPKEPLNKYYPSVHSTGTFSPKHLSKEFIFTGTPTNSSSGYRRHSTKNSDYWTIENVDLVNGAGVYVALDKFEYFNATNGYSRGGNHLVALLDNMTAAGIDVPKIYGFKASSAAKAKSNPNFVTLWDYLDKAIETKFTSDAKLTQDFINRQYVKDELSGQSYLHSVANIANGWKNLNPNSELKKFFGRVQEIHKYKDAELSNLKALLVYTKFKPTGKPVYDILQDKTQLVSRYPLLFKLTSTLSSDYRLDEKDWHKPMEDYINLVDLVTP